MAPTPQSGRRPVHTNPTRRNRTARAPYNFVPLPEKIVTVEREQLPKHDRYAEGTHTGWFACELETCSPTYVRGMMTLEQFEKYDPDQEKTLPETEQASLKEVRAPFYSTTPDDTSCEDRAVPMLPGSSLRGLIRSLVEIIGYGKMRWVNDTPKVTFRAVAAPREDPLSEPYKNLIGPFSRNVQAGYLKKTSDGWQIQPAQKPRDLGLNDNSAFLKVKESRIPNGAIPTFVRFNDANYWPGYYAVRFSASTKRGRRGPYVSIDQIGDKDTPYPHQGTLVCTGNMLEIASPDTKELKSPRRNHTLIPQENTGARPLRISQEVLQDYRDSLTDFQRDALWQEGGLKNDAPVFYLAPAGKVIWFGHTPNFRIPALNTAGHPTTPLDFIPQDIRQDAQPDLAEAIFGWVEEQNNVKGQFAGRVSVSDAQFVTSKNGVWASPRPLAPAILGGPKITTFQHYLVQDRNHQHDPDVRQTLAHYGGNLSETEIRGFKLYWHKGDKPHIKASDDEKQKEKQLTRMLPVKPGVRFTFRVHFENLRSYELGALAWALLLPGEQQKTYRHKLGMGKPLGMGAIQITATLHLTDRLNKETGRYGRFLTDNCLADGASQADPTTFIDAFEKFVLQQIAPEKKCLIDLDRIRMLLALLQWREGTADWSKTTRYQSIQPDNEYKERPVLPDPLALEHPLQNRSTILEAPSTKISSSLKQPTTPSPTVTPHYRQGNKVQVIVVAAGFNGVVRLPDGSEIRRLNLFGAEEGATITVRIVEVTGDGRIKRVAR